MNRTRAKQVVIRMSDEEYAAMKQKVEASGMKQSEYLIKCITNKNVMNTDGMKELAIQLKRVGVNLNQIAEALNGKGYYEYGLITQNQKELSEIWQLLKQYLQRRG